MQITSIDTIIYGCPYNRPEPWRFGVRKGTTTVIIKINTDLDVNGLGEIVCPLPPVFVERYIKDEIAPILVGLDPREMTLIRNRLLFELGFDWMLDFGGFFLAGVETALFDITGKYYKCPAYQLIGGKAQDHASFGAYIFSGASDQMFADVEELAAKGVSTFKIKINVDEDEEFRFFEKVVNKFGTRVHLAVDVNQGWNIHEAIRKLERLAIYPISFVEQPLERSDYKGARWLRQHSPIPIALNEGISSLQTMKIILQEQAADVLVLDILSVGGVIALQQIANLARINGIPLVSHSGGELDIATMMMANIVISDSGFRFHNDTYAYYLSKPVSPEINSRLTTGKIVAEDWSGIGVDIDFDVIKTQNDPTYYSPFDK